MGDNLRLYSKYRTNSVSSQILICLGYIDVNSNYEGDSWSRFVFVFFSPKNFANKWLVPNCPRNDSLKARLRNAQFLRKTAGHLFQRASCGSKFCLIWLNLEDPYYGVLFSLGIICTNTILYKSYVDTPIVFFEEFLAPVDTNFFDKLFMQYLIKADRTTRNTQKFPNITISHALHYCLYVSGPGPHGGEPA